MTIETRRPLPPSSFAEETAIAEARLRMNPTHWKCPDCFQPCRCDGDARLAPHERCGLAAERR